MSRAFWLILFLAGATSIAAAPAQTIPSEPAKALRIGTFDSRAVAVAYYNSEEHRAFMRELMAGYNQAKASGDATKIKEYEAKGPALQNLTHLQVFSHASIPNILEKLKEVLPAVAEKNGVAIIVSKWEIAYRQAGVEYVDVTEELVKPFKPDGKVQGWIDQMKEKEPLPLVQIATMPHTH